jgi:hypothetical protein
MILLAMILIQSSLSMSFNFNLSFELKCNPLYLIIRQKVLFSYEIILLLSGMMLGSTYLEMTNIIRNRKKVHGLNSMEPFSNPFICLICLLAADYEKQMLSAVSRCSQEFFLSPFILFVMARRRASPTELTCDMGSRRRLCRGTTRSTPLNVSECCPRGSDVPSTQRSVLMRMSFGHGVPS